MNTQSVAPGIFGPKFKVGQKVIWFEGENPGNPNYKIIEGPVNQNGKNIYTIENTINDSNIYPAPEEQLISNNIINRKIYRTKMIPQEDWSFDGGKRKSSKKKRTRKSKRNKKSKTRRRR
tara:strand:+ start:669 stop:1028 length:360 start_codon:yes stop_codon:yes gene_type:complete